MPAKILRLLNICLAITLGGLFVACLDIPSDPDISGKIETIKVHTVQYGKVDSTTLKINPKDSSALVAVVYPKDKEKELQYFWYNNKTILDNGRTYSLTDKNLERIPNTLVVTDKEDNSQTVTFNVIVNSAPSLNNKTIPSNEEVIFADEFSPVQFQWKSSDSNDDKLTHILEIDSTQYNVGSLTKVYQSGLKAGEHSFRVIVMDSYGDADTLDWVKFKIVDPTAGADEP